jgi:hypothetical protein
LNEYHLKQQYFALLDYGNSNMRVDMLATPSLATLGIVKRALYAEKFCKAVLYFVESRQAGLWHSLSWLPENEPQDMNSFQIPSRDLE